MKYQNVIKVITAAVWLSATCAHADESRAIHAEQSVERRIIALDENGFETVRYEPATLVKPGDYLRYVLSYENRLEHPAEDIVLVMPVPGAMRFIPGSVLPSDVPYQVSYDKGASFIPTPAETPEGKWVTHIRWTFDRDLKVDEDGQVSFAAILK